jgi:tetratricopeptide (TPR) repeat protein
VADLDKALTINDAKTPRARALLLLRSVCHAAGGRSDLATADLKQADQGPNDLAPAVNSDAWNLLMSPPERRADAAALVLAKQAAAKRPLERRIQNTLSLALYRNGRYVEAIEVAHQNLAVGPWDYEAWDLYILAMCQHRLGQTNEAVRSFERAAASQRQKPSLDDEDKNEALALEDEARRALGLARSQAAVPSVQ